MRWGTQTGNILCGSLCRNHSPGRNRRGMGSIRPHGNDEQQSKQTPYPPSTSKFLAKLPGHGMQISY